jgi:hypothetical protein
VKQGQQHQGQKRRAGLREGLRVSKDNHQSQVRADVRKAGTYFEVLGDIENASYVKRIFFIEVSECISEVGRFNLPYPHEDKLVIRMTSEEHSKEFPRVF